MSSGMVAVLSRPDLIWNHKLDGATMCIKMASSSLFQMFSNFDVEGDGIPRSY